MVGVTSSGHRGGVCTHGGGGLSNQKKKKLAKIRKNFHIWSPNFNFISDWHVLGVGAEGVRGAAMGVAALSTKIPKLAKIGKKGNFHVLSRNGYFLFINYSVNEV